MPSSGEFVGYRECPMKGCNETIKVYKGKRRYMGECPKCQTINLQGKVGQEIISSGLVSDVPERVEPEKPEPREERTERKVWSLFS